MRQDYASKVVDRPASISCPSPALSLVSQVALARTMVIATVRYQGPPGLTGEWLPRCKREQPGELGKRKCRFEPMRIPESSVACFLLFCALPSLAQDGRPEFCAKVPDTVLAGLASPYARKVAPDGSAYCEGLLRAPIALAAPRVVSVKQLQEQKPQFITGSRTLLTWCDKAEAVLHLSLRSLKAPMFALDARQKERFEWSADLIARWQPDWNAIAARGSRDVDIDGRKYEVVLPLRIGTGNSSRYSFTVQGKVPVRLSTALIEPVSPMGAPEAIDIVASPGPTSDTWTIAIPFEARHKGVFRITFGEGVEQPGVSTEPIYLLHGGCTTG